MANIYVFENLPWNPPVVSSKRLLTAPKLTLNVFYTDEELKEMPGKQKAIFKKAFDESFDTKFNKLGKDRIQAVQEAMDWTEERIEAKPTKEEREEVVNTANKLLEKAFATFEQELAALCAACYQEALDKSMKAMKRKLFKAKAKSVAKIVVISLLVLTAAALTIAATVVTGGAAAAVILGAIATGGAALWKVYKEVDGGWATSANAIKQIQADIAVLKKSADVFKASREKQQLGAAPGIIEKLKTLKAAIDARFSDLDKHVGQLDKYIFDLQTTLKSKNEDIQALADKIAENNDPELIKQATDLKLAINSTLKSLNAITEVSAAAAAAKKDFAEEKVPDFGKLDGALGVICNAAPYLQKMASPIKAICKQAAKLAGA